ncbi:hypothetical protein ISS06_00110 [Patescibacteria group bacterium]|nr:hypothetical protein [Patescibacteria group bacterium]
MEKDIIQEFVQGIIKKAGIDNMPADFKKKYVEKLAVEAQRRLGMVAIDAMDEQGLKDFEKFMQTAKNPKPDEVLEFFSSRIPDFQQKITGELEKFGKEFIAGADRLKGTKLSE